MKKMILIGLVIVVMMFVAGCGTGKAVQTGSSSRGGGGVEALDHGYSDCYDTDMVDRPDLPPFGSQPYDLVRRGTIKYDNYFEDTDFCLDNASLVEYYCEDSRPKAKIVNCTGANVLGCNYGGCKIVMT